MADHEIELAAKFGLPEIHGFAAGLEGRYRASWTSRGRQLQDAIQAAAEVTQDELEAAIESNPAARDALWRALNRAVEVSDVEYIGAMGRLVAAVLDEAKVDAAAYLLAQLLKIEPVHLRCLTRTFDFALAAPGASVEELDGPDLADGFVKTSSDLESLATRWDIDRSMASSVVNQLEAAGFLRMESKTIGRDREEEQIGPTPWAVDALRLLFPQLEHEGYRTLAGTVFRWPDGSHSSPSGPS